jgi:uncharacterized membrane protein YfcA
VTELFTTDALGVLVVSFAIGIVVGLTGMGGGALMTPALIFLGIPPTAAVANDLVAAALNKSVGAAVHWRGGSPNLRLVGWLVAGSVPCALAGAFLLRLVAPSDAQEDWLKLAIGATLLLTAATYLLRMLMSVLRPPRPVTAGTMHVRPVPTVLVGAVGGLLVGLTSVGSGSLIMVALLLLHPALSPRRMVGTDLAQAIPLVVAAAIGHVINSGVDWEVLIPLVVGGSPGTLLGAKLAARVPQGVIRRGIVLVLTLTALTLLRVPPAWVGVVGAGLVILGPVAWSIVREQAVRHRPLGAADADRPEPDPDEDGSPR